jgi:hypothetical protein
MPAINVKNNATVGIQVWEPEYKVNQTFTSAGAGTEPAGMILALNTATSKWVPYVSAGANGTGVPSAILAFDIVSTGAGDYPINPLIGGRVREAEIGVSSALTAPNAVEVLGLRDYGITAQITNQLGELDNQ